jgi:hypothetical protein
MKRRTAAVTGVATVAGALALGGGAWALAGGGDDEGGSVGGPQADRASAAALAYTKGGTANAVERDDEGGATWEVEVTRPDGTTVDVRLDAAYAVVEVDSDDEASDNDG